MQPQLMGDNEKSQLVKDYRNAHNRLILLDYDGVLSPLVNDPSPDASRPSDETLAMLKGIANQPDTHLYVVSGRTKSALEGWFGTAQNIGLSAEHGAWRKNSGQWQQQVEPFDKLKEQVVTAMRPFTERVPGSHIETKDFAVVWHFRAAHDVQQALKAVPDLEAVLGDIVKGSELAVYTSAITGKIIEVKPRTISKGSVAESLIVQFHHPDFICVIGDDYTDEHAFAACPPESWTIRVGEGETHARSRLAGVPEVLTLLEQLSTSE